MGKQITISVGKTTARAELNDSPCAAAVYDALPITGSVNTWGEEIYFATEVDCPLDDGARSAMTVGELAYWPAAQAVCIFFGATPASGKDGAPRAASDVNPIGRVVGDASVFHAVGEGEKIVLRKAEA